MQQATKNTSVSVSTSSAEALQNRADQADTRRTMFSITALTGSVTVTVAKGDVPAVANQGIVLTQNQTYLESNDAGFPCWQGAVQVIASGSGTIAVSETVLLGR